MHRHHKGEAMTARDEKTYAKRVADFQVRLPKRKTPETAEPIGDAQLEIAVRNIQRVIRQDRNGYFNHDAVNDIVEHFNASGLPLLTAMSLASFSDHTGIPKDLTKREVENRAKALYAHIVLGERVGEERLKQFLMCEDRFKLAMSMKG
jgi:hypothetical protein